MRTRTFTILAFLLLATVAHGGPVFSVVIDPELGIDEPVSGRLVLYLLSADSPLYERSSALDGPFFDDPQPVFGVDVEGLAAGERVEIGDDATAFPCPPSELEPTFYRVGAVLDRAREHSSWRREAGNLYSDEYTLLPREGDGGPALTIVLSNRTEPEAFDPPDGVTLVEAGGLLAAVIEPISFDPEKTYPTIYTVPSFGGDHTGAIRDARSRDRLRMDDPRRHLLTRAFTVYLDPEGPNGHHLFLDSPNNGDVETRLIEDLIPAIERAHPAMRTDAAARIVTGHSSGGWTTLHLALHHPETFGAAWASAPDPVDFRAFQLSNLYEDDNLYEREGRPVTSYQRRGAARMTVRQENLMEEAIGPRNTSAQQWDSWLAAFGPADDDGHPGALFDPQTGAIDRSVVEHFARHDLGRRLREDPERYLPLFRERIRLVVGDEDNYFLHEAVALLKDDLARLSEARGEPDAGHRVRILPGPDHSSVWREATSADWPREIMTYIASLGAPGGSGPAGVE